MTRKNTNNKDAMGELEKSISSVLVVNDKDLKPYIELFEYTGENIVQQQLGTLLGIFEIRDETKDSAYIVNFLTSVVKKEYFINPKRPVIECFEATLHKANLALSELANHGNVEWIGKLDSVVCVLERNYLHFSVTGNARVLLLRNNVLTDISEGLAVDDPEPHPIKTFSNISSGKLENGDKIIITGEDLFHVFSLTEIKKGALRFDKEKFIQFIRTALINELDVAGTIIIDITEKQEEVVIEEKPEKKSGILNAFSEKAFRDSSYKSIKITGSVDSDDEVEYTDKKTGHIYVQGEYGEQKENALLNIVSFTIKETISDLSYWLEVRFNKLSEKIRKTSQELKSRAAKKRIEILVKKQPEEKIFRGDVANPVESSFNKFKKNFGYFVSKLSDLFSRIPSHNKFLPDLSKIKDMFLKMNYQQRMYSLLIILAIIFVPIIWIKYQDGKTIVSKEEVSLPTPAEILSQDKNIKIDAPTQTLYSGEGVIKTEIISDALLAIKGREIIEIVGDQSDIFSLPENSGNVVTTTSMDDLSLLFLLTDHGEILSFSPVSNKFQQNNIILPENARVENIATYLTYAYLVDSQNNQIYRYPRAEGGFGERADWLKANLDLSNISDIAIDENIYLATGDRIIKLFKGLEENISLEQSATPIKFNKIFSNAYTENIYVLDNNIGRIIKYTKNGELLSQYHNESLKNARDIAVDEKNNKAYFITSSNLDSIDL